MSHIHAFGRVPVTSGFYELPVQAGRSSGIRSEKSVAPIIHFGLLRLFSPGPELTVSPPKNLSDVDSMVTMTHLSRFRKTLSTHKSRSDSS